MKKTEYAKYLVTFLVTAGLFATIFYVSKVVSDSKLRTVKSEQDALSINLLSSEIQFSLLKTVGCSQDGASILAPEIGELGGRLDYMEKQLGVDNSDVISLKKYYSLLQIKDYILTKELASRCKVKPVTILYFYTNECDECIKQGYVLTALHEKYPGLRVYSFDSGLDLSAIKTLESMNVVTDAKPVLVIDNVTYAGLKTIEEIEEVLAPQLDRLKKPVL